MRVQHSRTLNDSHARDAGRAPVTSTGETQASQLHRYKTPEQGAATSVLVATSPQLEGVGGRYFEDCNEAPVVDPVTAESTGEGVAAYALDPTNAERLWELSLAAVS